MKNIAFFLSFLFAITSFAGTFRDVTMPDSAKVQGKTLVLNGMGLREVTVLMIPVHVYIGGLYVEKKTKNADEVAALNPPKLVKMQFLLRVGPNDYRKAWRDAFKKQCPVTGPNKDCAQFKDKFNAFLDMIQEVKSGEVSNYTFDAKGVEIESGGKKWGRIDSPELASFMLNGWIGAKGIKPFDESLADGMLGGNKI